jgi:hypothetical protein
MKEIGIMFSAPMVRAVDQALSVRPRRTRIGHARRAGSARPVIARSVSSGIEEEKRLMEIENIQIGGYVAQTCKATGDVFIGIAREASLTTGTVRVQWAISYCTIVIVSELSPVLFVADSASLRSGSMREPTPRPRG